MTRKFHLLSSILYPLLLFALVVWSPGRLGAVAFVPQGGANSNALYQAGFLTAANTSTNNLLYANSNFVIATFYTNLSGSPLVVQRVTGAFVAAATAGRSAISVEVSGMGTNVGYSLVTSATTTTGTYTNPLASFVVPTNSFYRFMDTSSGAGNSATLSPTGQVVWLSQTMTLPTLFAGTSVGLQGSAFVIHNGVITGNYSTLAAAKTAAVSGDTVWVMPGIYAENDLAKDGVSFHGEPGAHIIYVQTTTNDAGLGLFDDRGHGPIRMSFDWPGQMTLISVTNVLLDDTNELFHTTFSPNQLGVLTHTNPASQFRGHIGEVSGLNYMQTPLYLLVQMYGSNSTLRIDRMLDLGLDTSFDLAPYADPGNNLTGPNVAGWFVGNTFSYAELHCPYMAVTGQSWYWLEQNATAKTNDFYFYAGFTRGNMYGIALTPLYRWWVVGGIELTGAGASGLVACYGGGKGYFDYQKMINPQGIVYNTTAASGISNSQIYIRSMKWEGSTKFADITAGSTTLDVDQFLANGAMVNGITTVPGAIVIPQYAVSGLTNVAAAATSLLVSIPAGAHMPGTNYTPSVSFGFNPVAIVSFTGLTRTNFTVNFSAGVTTGGAMRWTATQNIQ